MDFALPSSAKKLRQEQEEREEEGEGEGEGVRETGEVREEVEEKPQSSRRRRDETTKIGKVFVPK